MSGIKDVNTERWQTREARWASMLAEAENLPVTEALRHALVSLRNNHRCRECFCCACLTQYLAVLGGSRRSRELH
jgi:hypothetical protein